MEQIKKKMTALREENEKALERAETAENKLKDIERELDEVSGLHFSKRGVVNVVWPASEGACRTAKPNFGTLCCL
jgi:hypothetical protein